MQCPHCEYNSAGTRAPGAFLAKHLVDDHDYQARAAIETSKAIHTAPTASDTAAELAALRDEVARLRAACQATWAWIEDLYEWEHEGRQEYHKREIVDMLRAALRGGG